MEIRTLKGVSREAIYRAFVEAFSDYEVDTRMSYGKFIEMMVTRDLNPAYSIGGFDGERLVSFILCGYRENGDLRRCYDGGTGTVKEFRRRGVGGALLSELIASLKVEGVHRFELEVLEHNAPAIALYAKNGFARTRKFECFEASASAFRGSALDAPGAAGAAEVAGPEPDFPFRLFGNIDECAALDHGDYLAFRPSWQNDIISIRNVQENYECLSLVADGLIAGYGLVHRTRGDIPQIGVHSFWRGRGVEKIIIRGLAARTASERLSVLNVEEGMHPGPELRMMGFSNFVNQYEMALDLQ